MHKTLSPIFWLWIPIVAFALQILFEIFAPENILFSMHNENGTHETLQALVMAVGCLFAIYCVFKSNVTPNWFLKFWFGLAALCCFYVAGEEISWGQHIWDWATPDFWEGVNDQQETNLHNTSSWFDQKPRLILIFGIVVGTLVLPYLKRKKIYILPQRLDELLPSPKLRLLALLVVIPQLVEKLFEAFDIQLFARFSEVQELYIFYFVLIYLITLSDKIKSRA